MWETEKCVLSGVTYGPGTGLKVHYLEPSADVYKQTLVECSKRETVLGELAKYHKCFY